MYVYHMRDYTWRIAPLTSSKYTLPYGNRKVMALYNGVYDTRAAAEAAVNEIKNLIETA
jgi:hypothetical protein